MAAKRYLGITGDVLHNAIRNKLKQFVVTPEAYKQYADYLKNQLAIIQRVKSEEIRNLTVRINSYRAKFNDFINDNLSIQREEDEQRAYDKKKKDYQSEIATLEDQLADAKRNERNEIVELEFFMGIMNKALEYYDKGSYVQKAKISKILLSNIILDAQKRLTITVNPVFENLFVLCGGDNPHDLERSIEIVKKTPYQTISSMMNTYQDIFPNESKLDTILNEHEKRFYGIK